MELHETFMGLVVLDVFFVYMLFKIYEKIIN